MVYIIEDSEVTACLIEYSLHRTLKLRALKFTRICDALNSFLTEPPSALIVDLNLLNEVDGANGIHLGQILTQHQIDVPRILISTDINPFLEENVRNAGFQMFISKMDKNYMDQIREFVSQCIPTQKNLQPKKIA